MQTLLNKTLLNLLYSNQYIIYNLRKYNCNDTEWPITRDLKKKKLIKKKIRQKN